MAKSIKINYAELNESLVKQAEEIQKHLVLDKDSGVISQESNTFEATLPEGVTMAEVKKVEGAISDYIAASAIAVGNLGLEGFVAKKELKSVSAVLPIHGRKTIEHKMEREVTGSIPGKDETFTHYGRMFSSLTTPEAKSSSGQLKKIRKVFGEAAAEALAK